jgi:glycosyltransferase involved in cell wall biosynthesis
VVPSLWPEPLGLVGTEAAAKGIPVAAFAVGGIPEWLVDGVNGTLADGNPPTSEGLAEAIVRCLADPVEYDRLSRGALATGRQLSLKPHIEALSRIFETSASRDNPSNMGVRSY